MNSDEPDAPGVWTVPYETIADRRAKILERWKRGWTQTQLAASFRVSVTTVAADLRAADPDCKTNRRPPSRWDGWAPPGIVAQQEAWELDEQVLRMREYMTLREIGERLGVGVERVRQREMSALRRRQRGRNTPPIMLWADPLKAAGEVYGWFAGLRK